MKLPRLFFLIFLLLGACAPQQLSFQVVSPNIRQAQLSQLQQWMITGSFSIQEPSQLVMATYRWEQQHSDYRIRIFAPLHLSEILIQGKPGQVTLWRSSQDFDSASSPEQLMQQELGWQLPISQLIYWIKGMPAPGPRITHFDDYGHLAEL